MSGYAYSPRFRLVDPNGNETTYDLTQMTDARGPVGIAVSYEPEKTSRTTPGRKQIERYFGFRPVCRMKFEIGTLADEACIASIVNACNAQLWTVYLSLDGGATERIVILSTNYARVALGGKTLVGIEAELEFQAVDVVDSVPSIVTLASVGDSRISDGSLETWSSGTTLQCWTFSADGSPAYAALQTEYDSVSGLAAGFLRGSSGTYAQLYQFVYGLLPGQSYRYSYWYKANPGHSTVLRCWMKNMRTNYYYNPATGLWQAGAAYVASNSTVSTWTAVSVDVAISSSNLTTDAYLMVFDVRGSAADYVYLDEIGLTGPIITGGVTQW